MRKTRSVVRMRLAAESGHVAPAVAVGLRRRHPSLVVENGALLGQSDSACLQPAAAQRLPLLTYDRRTIPPLLGAGGKKGKNRAERSLSMKSPSRRRIWAPWSKP